jgi:FMN-dependent NADH-azoreductase
MSTLLYVAASPRSQVSESARLAEVFLGTYHSTYFDDWLRFSGITDITTNRFQPTLLTPDVESARKGAIDQTRKAAMAFGTSALVMSV